MVHCCLFVLLLRRPTADTTFQYVVISPSAKRLYSLPVFFFYFLNNWTVRALHSPDHTPVHRLLHLTHTHTPLEVKEPVDVGSPLSSTPCYSPPSCSAIGPDSLSHFSLLLRGNQATPKFNCHVQVSILKKTFHAQSDTRPFVFS